jgi:glycosyltransferase involved in cell wall biosynthesis
MIKVGFVLSMDSSWQGGINYFKNLFNAIYQLPNRQLDLIIFIGSKNFQLLTEELPQVRVVVSSAFDRYSVLWWIRKFFQKIFYKDPILWFFIRKYHINVLSHFNESALFSSTPIISWIPDFQHIHLPNLFTNKAIKARNKLFKFLIKYSKTVILSSHTAKSDLIKFMPLYDKKVKVLQFCINPKIKNKESTTLLELQKCYKFQGNYFFLPNQFWAHKNHQVVIDALALAVNKNKDIQVICTGNTKDCRQPEHFELIQNQVLALGIEKNFKILGLVPYKDLIALMKYSVAVINPSHFEGWSTTVEESKLLEKTILLSKIPVHEEQNPKNAIYFDVNDSQILSNYFLDLSLSERENINTNQEDTAYYQKLFVEFGDTYQQIVIDSIQR